jgi:N-acyl-D-amino-acid deacylase
MFDLKIKGGLVIDGTGRPAFRADVGIRGDGIREIGDLSAAEAIRAVDAAGKYLCPGFIDVHSHSDAYLLIEPSAPSKIFQGVTTEVLGNCGASAAPRVGRYPMPSDWCDKKYPGPWKTVTEYRELLDRVKPAVNVVLLIGHNAIRAGIMGYEGRAATEWEFKAMADLLAKSLDEGGAGLSTGLIYSPGMFATPEEIIGLARVVAQRGKIYTSHMRSEGAKLLEAIDETIEIGRQSGTRVQISHLKTSGRNNWHLIDVALDKIRKAQAEGTEVASDRYPYTAACTDLDVILPDWASEGGRETVLKRLRDPRTRKRIRDDLAASRDGPYWESVTVGTTHCADNRLFQGMPLLQVAKQLSLDPADAALYLIDTDELHTGGIFFGMNEANMWKILREPYVMIGSDASVRSPEGPLSNDHPHPRAYGAFPRFLRAALDGKTVSVPEAVRKMTSLPAEQFRLKDRGVLATGKRADVIVFDPAEVRDRATYEKPHQFAKGINLVVVNGVVTLQDGRLTGHRAGQFLQ